MKIECKNKDNFSVYRSQRTNVRIEKSNAWIINCELCTIDLTVWGLALIFDFLIISFCSVSTGRIKIFTQVRWSLQTECGYNNFDRLFIFLTVNQLIEDSVTLRYILIIWQNIDCSCTINYNIYINWTFLFFLMVYFMVNDIVKMNCIYVMLFDWVKRETNSFDQNNQYILIGPVLIGLTSKWT